MKSGKSSLTVKKFKAIVDVIKAYTEIDGWCYLSYTDIVSIASLNTGLAVARKECNFLTKAGVIKKEPISIKEIGEDVQVNTKRRYRINLLTTDIKKIVNIYEEWRKKEGKSIGVKHDEFEDFVFI